MLLATIGSSGGPTMIVVEGSLLEITSDISFLMHEVYKKLSKEDPNAGEIFKTGMQCVVTKEDSPMWEDEKEEKR